jgi:hypothetical protein
VAADTNASFDAVRQDFLKRGCVALQFSPCEKRDNMRASAMGVMAELMGDDLDGMASMMDDFNYLGLLD